MFEDLFPRLWQKKKHKDIRPGKFQWILSNLKLSHRAGLHGPFHIQCDDQGYRSTVGYKLGLMKPAVSLTQLPAYVAHKNLQSVAKLVTHSAKFWNFLDERRTTAVRKLMAVMRTVYAKNTSQTTHQANDHGRHASL